MKIVVHISQRDMFTEGSPQDHNVLATFHQSINSGTLANQIKFLVKTMTFDDLW